MKYTLNDICLCYDISAPPMIQGSPTTMMQQQEEQEIQMEQQMEQQQIEQQQIEQQQQMQMQMQMQMQNQQQMMNPMFQPMMQTGPPPGFMMIPPNGQLQGWQPQAWQPQTWDLGGGSRVTISEGLVVVDTSGGGWGNGNYAIM